jgi:hypothetical protein
MPACASFDLLGKSGANSVTPNESRVLRRDRICCAREVGQFHVGAVLKQPRKYATLNHTGMWATRESPQELDCFWWVCYCVLSKQL